MKKPKRQNIPTDHRNSRTVSFLIISLLLHSFLSFVFTKYSDYLLLQTDARKNKETSSVQFVDMEQMNRWRGEMAEQDKANNKKPPKTAKFLSEKNNQTEKETRAAQRGDFQNKKDIESAKASAAQAPSPQSAMSATTHSEMQTFAHGDLAAPAKKPKKAKTISDLRLNSVQDMAQTNTTEASQTNDYLNDVAIGAETHLNTREFLYFTYFNRIKKKLRQNWEPLIHSRVQQIVKTGRDIASSKSRVTRLVITLDENGGLSRVQVTTTSGLMDLDDVAIEALRVSAPFPNPPKDLIENGHVRIHWDFILES